MQLLWAALATDVVLAVHRAAYFILSLLTKRKVGDWRWTSSQHCSLTSLINFEILWWIYCLQNLTNPFQFQRLVHFKIYNLILLFDIWMVLSFAGQEKKIKCAFFHFIYYLDFQRLDVIRILHYYQKKPTVDITRGLPLVPRLILLGILLWLQTLATGWKSVHRPNTTVFLGFSLQYRMFEEQLIREIKKINLLLIDSNLKKWSSLLSHRQKLIENRRLVDRNY